MIVLSVFFQDTLPFKLIQHQIYPIYFAYVSLERNKREMHFMDLFYDITNKSYKYMAYKGKSQDIYFPEPKK